MEMARFESYLRSWPVLKTTKVEIADFETNISICMNKIYYLKKWNIKMKI